LNVIAYETNRFYTYIMSIMSKTPTMVASHLSWWKNTNPEELYVLSRVWETKDGVQIGNWIY
jgi:hypothetical protein